LTQSSPRYHKTIKGLLKLPIHGISRNADTIRGWSLIFGTLMRANRNARGAGIAQAMNRLLSFDAGKIQYCNKETGEIDSINPEAPEIKSVLTRPYFFKSIDYEFEREVRLIIDAETRGHGRLLTDISNEIIDKVVFSPWTKLNEFESLSEIVTRFCPKAVVTRSSLIKDLDDERTESAIQDLLEAQPSRDENVP
jgi:hypothetical protein